MKRKILKSKAPAPLDPIKIEVIHNALISFIKEMRHSIIRTSFGPSLRERHDFSCALQAPDGELVAIYQDNPPHIVPTVYAVHGVLGRFGDDIHPGDIILINDPYILGGHMNDVTHLYPIFAAGRLILWIVIRLHYTDIGGMAPGSITPDSTDVYQEGIRIPAVKAYQAGEPNDAFLDAFFANVRMPEERKADFMSLVASFWTSEKRLRDILDTHGTDSVIMCGEIVRDRAERRMRDAIAKLPDGDYAYELNLDSDGIKGRWIPLRVTVRVEGDSMTVDFSESAPSVVGPMNGSEATAACAAFVAVKGVLDPTPDVNGGSFRPVRVVTRAGTLFQALPPAPTCGAQDLMHRATSVVLGALAPAVPANALGDHCGPGHHYMPGWDPETGRPFIMYDSPIGGTGAVQEHDGDDVLAGFERGDHGRIMPMEVHETEFPFLAEFNELRGDSGGAGKQRGGLGVRRGWRMVRGSGTVTDMAEPSFTPYHGLLGAHGGAANTTLVVRDDAVLAPAAEAGKVVRFPIQEGDLVQILKWGGGGYGDPLDRDPRAVLDDVAQEYVSPYAARELYGVVISDGAVDEEATGRSREQLRAQRVYLTVAAVDQDTISDDTRLWHLAPEVAGRLTVEEGDAIECVAPGTAPLRGRARICPGQPAEHLPTGPFALQVFRIRPGDRVWVRKLNNPMQSELGDAWPPSGPTRGGDS
ncbi:MAG: hydantoinase B/oxoprolinase family protein [Dehalococcoidia bacterium]|jgi:N-methylhydantoinase B|nr:hydantoinase B/oxoprolinase family protein [Dehalococcoidia bacterium]